jgi:hypothetical protein
VADRTPQPSSVGTDKRTFDDELPGSEHYVLEADLPPTPGFVDSPSEWLFSFGYGHRHANQYVRIRAWRNEEARQQMVRRFGREWAFQYEANEEAELQRHGMTEWEPTDG